MKSIGSIFAVLLISITSTVAQDRAIEFEHGSWSDILAKAAKANKPVFVDAYATWCGPCKAMAKNVFTNNAVADYYNSNFINAKIDVEKNEGPVFAKKYNVEALPTFIFTDAQGNLLHRALGYNDVTQFLDLGKEAKSDRSLGALQKKFDQGERSTDFMKLFLKAHATAGNSTESIISTYFSKMNTSDLLEYNNWKLMVSYLTDTDSREMKYLLSNKSQFDKKFTADSVDAGITKMWRNIIGKKLRTLNASNGENEFNQVIAESKKLPIQNADHVALPFEAYYSMMKKDWSKAADALQKMSLMKDASSPQNLQLMNQVGWSIFEKSEDKKILQQAVIATKPLSDSNIPMFMDTHANLLFKSGHKEEAIRVEEAALEILMKNPDENFSIEDCKKTINTFKES